MLMAMGQPETPDLTGFSGRFSSVTYGELNFGVAVAGTDLARKRRSMRLQRIAAVFGAGVLFDDLVAASYGHLFGIMHASGRRSRSRTADLMIAATAHSLGVPLLTRNPADFAAISGELDVVSR